MYMMNAIDVRIDATVNAGYVRYKKTRAGECVASSARISQDVVVDFDADGLVIGIELISIVPDALATARDYAAQNQLVFPDIRSNAAAQ
jgi:uncharacterized protein YuzE